MKILRVDSSVKPEGSVSKKLLDEIIVKLGTNDVTVRNANDVPAIDAHWLGAVFTPEADRSAEQSAIATRSDALITEITEADVIVIGVPVYNFNIASGLKNWIDQIARVGVTFRYTETGPEGLIKGKRAILAFSSDGTAAGSDIDFAHRYMMYILGFVGITHVQSVTAQQMAFDKDAALKAAANQIAAL